MFGQTCPFEILRGAMLKFAQDSQFENNYRNTCPEFAKEITSAISQIQCATTFEQLAAVPWVAGQAAMTGVH